LPFISQAVEKTVTKRISLPYLLYLPPGFEQEADRKWPLVIFLHGAGERGSDLALVTRQGMARLVQQGRDFPFIMAAPQCPPDCTWDRKLDELDCLLEEIIQKYPVQTEQIYLTGLSMGGYGTWHWAARHPRAFAALVPICGGAMPLTGFPERAAVLKEVPIWAFHGEDDQIVPVQRSAELVQVLEDLDAPVRFTRYKGVGHNAWNRAYAEPALFDWLLAQKNTGFSLEKRELCEQRD
jgi:predicted peptidase